MASELYPDEKLANLVLLLRSKGIPYAIGGAIALFYWGEPRATADIDVNIFLPVSQARRVAEALAELGISENIERTVAEIAATAQARIDYEGVPVDLFFADLPFHDSCAARAVRVPFGELDMTVLSAEDLAICKAMFNRPKDWADIEQLLYIRATKFDAAYVERWLEEMLGEGHPQLERFRSLLSQLS